MSRGAVVVGLALVATTRVAHAESPALADRLDLGLAWHHVRAADGTSVVVGGAARLGPRAGLDGEAGAIVTAAGTSLRNVRIGAGVALAAAGEPVLRLALTLPLAARAGDLGAALADLASATPVDDRALRPALWAATLDARWRWAGPRRWFAIDAAVEVRGAAAASPGGRVPLRAAFGGGIVVLGGLELGADLRTAAAMLDAPAGGETFVHDLTLGAAGALRAWRLGATLQVPIDASARSRDAVVAAVTLTWRR